MADPKKTDKGHTTLCPECDQETALDAEGQGVCATCGLDVGWCLEKRRRDRAVSKLAERETGEKEKAKPGFKFGFQ